jgi:glycosyltransferase involved in cell wall biosynthesis
MSYKPSIDILLATYNGQKYLAEQINSVLTQSHQDWQLLIRDDGSLDDTVNIIKRYLRQYPHKIKMITDDFNHLGAKLNFGKLLEHAQADYVMFCDQDDVWLPRKIEVTLRCMRTAEKNYPNKPIMVHSDSIVVDDNLKRIAGSKWAYEKIWPNKDDNLNRILLQNVATGCTIMINKRAKNVSLPIPKDAIMHDWWVAIKVAEHGKIVYVPDQLVLYRQHPNNLVGAKKVPRIDTWGFLKRLFSMKERIMNHYRMVKKYDPNATFWVVVLKKIANKIAQKCR